MLFVGDGIRKAIVHQRMVQYSIASNRSDGTQNRVIMNGKKGYLGNSSVLLSYLEDGWIRVSGYNNDDSNGWKLLSEFALEPGNYTLTGMSGQAENTVALQMHYSDDTGFYRYLYQYDEDVAFMVERESKVTLYVRAYPNVANIDVKARPAVYRDE